MSSGFSSIAKWLSIALSLFMLGLLASCRDVEGPKHYLLLVFQASIPEEKCDFYFALSKKGKIVEYHSKSDFPRLSITLDLYPKEKFDGRVTIVNPTMRRIKLFVSVEGGHEEVEINCASYRALGVDHCSVNLTELFAMGKHDELLKEWEHRREKSKYLAIELEPGEEYPVPWRIK